MHRLPRVFPWTYWTGRIWLYALSFIAGQKDCFWVSCWWVLSFNLLLHVYYHGAFGILRFICEQRFNGLIHLWKSILGARSFPSLISRAISLTAWVWSNVRYLIRSFSGWWNCFPSVIILYSVRVAPMFYIQQATVGHRETMTFGRIIFHFATMLLSRFCPQQRVLTNDCRCQAICRNLEDICSLFLLGFLPPTYERHLSLWVCFRYVSESPHTRLMASKQNVISYKEPLRTSADYFLFISFCCLMVGWRLSRSWFLGDDSPCCLGRCVNGNVYFLSIL